MARGSKVFRPGDIPESNDTSYPEPFRESQRKRFYRRLGDFAGLKNYGVNLVRVAPGGYESASGLKKWVTRATDFVATLPKKVKKTAPAKKKARVAKRK